MTLSLVVFSGGASGSTGWSLKPTGELALSMVERLLDVDGSGDELPKVTDCVTLVTIVSQVGRFNFSGLSASDISSIWGLYGDFLAVLSMV